MKTMPNASARAPKNDSSADGYVAGRPVEILLVEDDPGDILLAREALADGKIRNNIHVAMDGEKAMAFLRREGEFANAPRPDIVMLDINMPRKNGREVLAEIKADPALATLPIAVVTGSKYEEEILQAYNLDVACFITKPINFEQFMRMVRCLDGFWLTVVTANPQRGTSCTTS